jgi:hypothetical protein
MAIDQWADVNYYIVPDSIVAITPLILASGLGDYPIFMQQQRL